MALSWRDLAGKWSGVKPELVNQIRFVGWTAEGRLRHARFLGLRSDKGASDVRKEIASSDPSPSGRIRLRAGLFPLPLR